jgi:glycogen phosphorylase
MGAVERAFPGDVARLGRMSLIAEGYPQKVRSECPSLSVSASQSFDDRSMTLFSPVAHLAVIGSHKVNGVAELHSQLVQTQLFPDFVEFLGSDHFTNIVCYHSSLFLLCYRPL